MLKKRERLSETDQVLFLSELGELIGSGYSLGLSLDIMASAHQAWAERLVTIQRQLSQGQGLTTSLGKILHPGVSAYLELGQAHGHFDQTLQSLGQNFDQVLTYKRQIHHVLAYPLFLLVFLIGLVAALETYLYPIFTTLAGAGNDPEQNNPALFYLHGLAVVAGGLFLTCLLSGIWLKRLKPLTRMTLLSRLPLVGRLVRTLMTYLIAEHLGILLAAGLTLPAIINSFAQTSIESRHSALVVEMATSVQRAMQSGRLLKDWTIQQKYLKPTLATYFDRGFTGPVLGTYLTYYAKNEMTQFDRQMKSVLAIIQPVFFTLIGLTIVLLYLAMLLPLYKNLGGMTI
ncbi:type II secretion system F family protein [Fructobacillus ficulneus]|uniref:ComG operon protein 2 n=1 Tax=Fructobacillus ficulneus TaxID=157463 RepID=A0A0K8MI77_9LACO|nr:type II secretion system F family protein [Fructobacillus ficulneus]GAO99564.1 ComG operon protein 2 [Fructobacillus ficulneus]